MPRDAGDGQVPAFKERQDHGAVDNNQLKVFSKATVRKAADVRHTQQRYQRAPIDNPQFAVLKPVRQASNMVECSPIAHSRDLRLAKWVFLSLRAATTLGTKCPLWVKSGHWETSD